MSPTARILALLWGWLGLGVAASFAPALTPGWAAAGAALGLASLVDALRCWRRTAPVAEREVPAALSMGVWTPVALVLSNPGARRLRVRVADHTPARVRAEGLPLSAVLPPGSPLRVGYRLWPEERGPQDFGPVELRVRSPFGLFERHLRAGAPQQVRVYPNFRAVMRYELMATVDRTSQLGIRRRPRRGEGLDFHQLREYRAGDALRQIDWKSTARLRRAISREYQDERDQQVVFLLDCGSRMHSRDGERSHFDAALDAVLLLAHVALRQGDAVGLMTFSGERRWLAPRKGARQLNAFLNAAYDLRTGPRAADYQSAARDLAARVRKRALVVLVSNLRGEDSDELAAGLRLLSRRHFVLLASLQESILRETLARPVQGLEDAVRASAIHLYLEERARALGRLTRTGALHLDAEPAELPVALVNGYLDIKAAGVL